AISSALLRLADGGEASETLRLYKPGREVAFGRQDVAATGYRSAVEAARQRGFEAIERLAGGRAAVFSPATIAFAWTIPDPDPRSRTERRFAMVAALLRTALSDLGIDARIGEVPGEYCPGRFSINAGGTIKLVGIGQRVTRRAAHVGGVIVVDDSAGINDILEPVYTALELDWRPQATGAIADVVPGAAYDGVLEAITRSIGKARPQLTESVDSKTMQLARQLAPSHISPT
ncbi:MAG: lipoate--protein ligase family protein, partial [Acidimicrobiia bacterium]|nr:lipoate--protein ligase family protein [Acidimicrobiia bacterium]